MFSLRYSPGSSVLIVSDQYEFGLPLGAEARVIEVDPSGFTATPYLVHVPAIKRSYWVATGDLRTAEEQMADEADLIIHHALLDFALATRNQILFDSLYPEPAR
ncbi:hypothetical protein [Cohnella nanjingensis]|uniref:Uncharacterized protein n=1 Tax=Cohnella nanjingensis TaxID=1387779 RepID=A0A7X0RSQ5_9BACL|nr:hypothetical protein [Cohnella nanjingensis]MBB6673008.1 hypothetical protein [Cohnella nanjingensis]